MKRAVRALPRADAWWRPIVAPLHAPRLADARCEGFVRARGPLRRVLAALAGRFVASRGWEPLGFARAGDHARERLGLSARSLQDLARVDATLARLPRLEAALVSGALSWTKVRLLCRVAQPEDEARWIAYARGLSARALAREVRAIDVGALAIDEEGAPEEERASLRVRCTPSVRAKWFHVRQLARRAAGEPLPPWQAIESVAAEVLSALPLTEPVGEGHPLGTPEPAPAREEIRGPGEEAWSGPSAELPRFLEDLVRDLAGADAFELDARLRRAVALEQRLDAELGDHLFAVAEGRLTPSLDVYAREKLGISPRKARGLLRIARTAVRVPALGTAWREGRISWARAQAIVPALLDQPERAREWIARAAATTADRLEEEVEAEAIRQAGAQPTGSGADPGAGEGARESCEIFWIGPADAIRLFRAALCTVRRRFGLATDGEAFDVMLDHAFHAWGGGTKAKRAWRVFARDGWRCTVPGCSSYRNLHDHHIVFRSAGGGHEEGNRTTLCAWHHLRGVHGVGPRGPSVRVSGCAPEGLRFELGLRPGRESLLVYGVDRGAIR